MFNFDYNSIVPWASGGLAGALLTQATNYLVSKRLKKKILLAQQTLRFYSVASDLFNKFEDEDIFVRFKDHDYKSLSRYNARIDNIGTESISDVEFVFIIPKDVTIVEKLSKTMPVTFDYKEIEKNTDNTFELSYCIPSLHKEESFQLSLFLDGMLHEDVYCVARNVDKVISSNKLFSYTSPANAISTSILFLLIILLIGNIPFVGGILQLLSLIILMKPLTITIEYIIKILLGNKIHNGEKSLDQIVAKNSIVNITSK